MMDGEEEGRWKAICAQQCNPSDRECSSVELACVAALSSLPFVLRVEVARMVRL